MRPSRDVISASAMALTALGLWVGAWMDVHAGRALVGWAEVGCGALLLGTLAWVHRP
jgi:hypothetical protein